MKKPCSILLILSIAISLSACSRSQNTSSALASSSIASTSGVSGNSGTSGTSNSSGTSNDSSNSSTNSSISLKAASKLISYLPTYSKAKLENYNSQTTANANNTSSDTSSSTKITRYGDAKYVIENATADDVYDSYKELYRNSGWTITQENKKYNFNCKKGSHSAYIIIQQVNKNVVVNIASK
jgi:hypothetical protein